MYPIINPLQSFNQGLETFPNLLQKIAAVKQAQQQNQLQNMLMQYAQPEAEARLNLLRAQGSRENALANAPLTRNEKIIPTADGFFAYNLDTGSARKISDATGNPLMPTKNGMQVTSTPEGGFSITTGGMQVTPPGQSITPQGGQPLPMSAQQVNKLQQLTGGQNIVTSPASPHSRYSTGGSTLFDTNTGQAVSVPTQAQAGKWQNIIGAGQIIGPQLQKIYKDIEPMIGVQNTANRFKGFLGQFTGDQDPRYSKYISALEGQIPIGADLLLKDTGLNNTTENRVAIQKAITPRDIGLHGAPDTGQTYAQRIADTLAGIAVRDKTYKKFLKSGISLSEEEENDPALLQTLSDKFYWDLRKSSAPSKTIDGKNYYKIDNTWHQD